MRVLGLNTVEGKKKVYNRRSRYKKDIFDRYHFFVQLCERHNVNCPESNYWAYKAFSKPSNESEEKSPVRMTRFKTTIPNPPKMLLNGGIGDIDDDFGKIQKCLNVLNIISMYSHIGLYNSIVYETPGRASRTSAGARDPFHIEFNLSLDTFYQTQPGWAVLFNQGFELVKLDIAFDYFEVIKFCHDPREISRESILTAELFEDGTGMVVKEPLIPSFFINNIKELSTYGSDKNGWGATRKRDYNKKMKAFEKEKQYRLTTIHFPKNIIGTNEFIGHKKTSTSDRKNVELRVFSNIFEFWHVVGNSKQLYPMYYAFWKIGIKGTMDDLSLQKKSDEQVDDACSGFKGLSMQKQMANGTL